MTTIDGFDDGRRNGPTEKKNLPPKLWLCPTEATIKYFQHRWDETCSICTLRGRRCDGPVCYVIAGDDAARVHETGKVTEEWRSITGYETIYEVSDHGRIRRVRGGRGARAGRVLKNIKAGSKSGLYHLVHLYQRGVSKTHKVHKLVAVAFLGAVPEDEFGRFEVHHIDGNLDNNHASNLAWKSKRENREEMWRRYVARGGL